MKAHRVSRAYKEYRKWPQVWNASIQYCFEYSKLCKELSNFGLQDAQNASSANCFALRIAHCGKQALKTFYIAIPAKNVAKAHPIIVLLVHALGSLGVACVEQTGT